MEGQVRQESAQEHIFCSSLIASHADEEMQRCGVLFSIFYQLHNDRRQGR